MSETRRKACPECKTLAPIDAPLCGHCGHAYRTHFASPPPAAFDLPAPPAPRVAPPPFRPPADPVPRAPVDPPSPQIAASSLGTSPSYALGRRRLPFLGAIAVLVILFRVFRVAFDLGCAHPFHR